MKVTIAGFVKAVTTAGTRVALKPATAWAGKVKIKALAGNAGVVYIGDSTVSATAGFQLAAGEEYDFPVDARVDLATVYADAATNGDAVSVVYLTEQA